MYEKMRGDHYQSTITQNAEDILKKRYFMKDDNGNVIEDFNGMCVRVAKCVSDVHKTVHFESDEKTNNYFKEYYSMLSNLDFLPNTPTLINAGKENGQSLSACFVCPVENNINEIFETIKNAVLIHKSGGGTGFNFSKVNNPTNKFIKDYFNINFSLNDNHKDYDKFKKSEFKYCNKLEYDYIDYKIDKKYIFIEDDLSSIFDFNIVYNWLTSFNYLDKKINVIIDFSHIRPEGEIISTSKGEASGPVSFMYAWDAFFEFISNDITPITTIKFFDACTNAVKQGGVRRGANMGILNSDNKYLEEFIHCKENESDITNFNLSVGVVNDKIFQDKLIDDIAKCAWKNGEPGLIFLDKINDKNTVKNHSIEATNPCFTGDMKLLTEKGYKTFEELCDTEPNIVNSKDNVTKSKVWCSGEKEIVRLKFSNDKIIKCTPNHIFRSIYGEEIEAKDLKDSNRRILCNFGKQANHNNELFLQLGFLQGDGNLTRLKSKRHDSLEVNIGKNDGEEISNIFKVEYDENKRKYYLNNLFSLKETLLNYNFSSEILPNRVFPKSYNEWNLDDKKAFLCGCFSANGSVINSHRIAYKTTCYKFAEEMISALKEFNIDAIITVNKSKENKFSNGDYLCKESYDININKFKDCINFYQNINFIQKYKQKSLYDLLLKKCPKCISVKYIGIEMVYDFEEPETHWGIVEDFIVHNCGEQPLLPYESCNLGSINLSNMVKVKHVKRPKFDWEKFKHTIWSAVEFLDDVIDANNYPIPEIEEASKKYRKIGLGVMGFADVLTMLDFPYDSANAKSIARKIAKTLKEESEKMSKMRESLYGPCPGCDDIIDGHSKRNAALTTIAPTGSISTICGCSSGIEPIFSVVYTRHTLNFEKDMYCIHPIFDEVIKDKYLDRYDEIIKDVYEKGSVTKVDCINNNIKDIFKSAGDIHFRQHIYMQSIWQEFVDNSISKTINFSENATINDIRDAFDYAYKGYVKDFNKHLHSVYEPLIRDINSDLGFCKGITVYRDKSRDKQVLETGSKNSSKQVPDVCTINSSVNNINSIENYINIPPKFNTIETVSNTTNSIRKRGDSLRGYTERIKIGCGELYVTVNFDDDGVREIFTTNGKSGGCHSQSEATCRMVSTALKYNIPTDVIIKQLKGIRCPSSIKNSGGCSLSCPDAIARCMEKCIGYEKNKKTDSYSEYYQQQFTKYYDEAIVNLTNIETLDSSKCPECGSPLEFEGGCQVCRSCGYSKCH